MATGQPFGTLMRAESWAVILFAYATLIDAERMESFRRDDEHLRHLGQLALVIHEPKGLRDEVRELRERIVRSPNLYRPTEEERRQEEEKRRGHLAKGIELLTARVIGGPKG